MARFYPLYVRRSDGKLEVAAKGKRGELNQPTDEQMDQKPDRNGVSDYYREVAAEEMKHIDWRRKLGGMLARELGHKDRAGSGEYSITPIGRSFYDTYCARDSGYVLVEFPENYRLYEHVKKTERDGKTDIKTKTHAGGGNDRQDAYLYGHPAGRKKRFRSPADFFPHLYWLCTDESGDPDNCGCKICSPEDLEALIPGAKVKMERPIKAETIETKAVPNNNNNNSTAVTSAVPRKPNTVGAQMKVESIPQRPASTSAPRPQTMAPTPLPQPKTNDQRLDSQYDSFMFRQGELVWFQRGQAWGLGVVLRRWTTPPNQHQYSVQPLSHPFGHGSPVTKDSDKGLRPWLAWSVPRFTNNGLNDMPEPFTYETANWQGIMQKQYGTGDLEIDASILAAKSIDTSYTPFILNKIDRLAPGVTEHQYEGVFLGAEKVWVGEPVRLRRGNGADVLVLHSVIERVQESTPNPQQAGPRSLQLLGDVYVLVTVAHSNPQIPSPAAPSNNPDLPRRLTDDLGWRNARSIQAKQQASFWKLEQTGVRVDISEVKGRWYEASLLLPSLINGFADVANAGNLKEAGLHMNARLDCQNANRSPALPQIQKTNIFRGTRREALGQAVPQNTQIIDDIPQPSTVDPALRSNPGDSNLHIDPKFENASGDAGGGLDEFMNLDSMDDHNSVGEFGQGYGAVHGQPGSFF